MSEREQNGLGRLMAGVLRHFPEKFNLQMDINGWISTSKLCDSFKEARHYYHWLRPWHFEAVALGDEKGRYQVEGDMVRATYGHSIEIELDLPTDDIPETLYYPCEGDDLATHLELGIKAGDRQHVHLSKTITNAMEAGHVRIKRPRILEIETEQAISDGHIIYRAGTTVFLSEDIPSLYLSVLPVDDQMIQEIEAVWEEE